MSGKVHILVHVGWLRGNIHASPPREAGRRDLVNQRLRLTLCVCLLFAWSLVSGMAQTTSASSPRSIPPPLPEHIVAAVLIAEAGGEGRAGLAAVMEVIQTRAQRKKVSWQRVVMEPKQFACLNKSTPVGLVNKAKRHALWPEAVRLASRGTATRSTNGATHFEMKSRRPKWAGQAFVTARVGNHVFYRLKNSS